MDAEENRQTITYRDMVIIGCNDFATRTRVALDLVGRTTYRATVAAYLKRIVSAKRTGAVAWQKLPTMEVGVRTWKSSPDWYASGIVHEAIHCKLYICNRKRVFFFNFTPLRAWTGADAEIICMKAGLDALQQLDAPAYMQRYVADNINNPTHHLIPYNLVDW